MGDVGGCAFQAILVLWIAAFLANPLWREFHEPGQSPWNTFLAAFLIAIKAAAFFGLRCLQQNKIEAGEARFTATRHDK